jgi:hypothetical protein
VAGEPGVAAVVLRAAGFEQPVLVGSYFPFGTNPALRISPNPLTVSLPSNPSASTCASVVAFVTPPGGTERALSSLEMLALEHLPAPSAAMLVFDDTAADQVCVQWFPGADRTDMLEFGYLGANAMLSITATH